MILTAWVTTRRTAESAYISWDCTFYEATFACAYIAMYQSNVDEEKPFALVADECMWLCWCPPSRPATVPASSSRITRASPADPRPAARPLGSAQRAPHGAHLGSRKSHSNLGRNRPRNRPPVTVFRLTCTQQRSVYYRRRAQRLETLSLVGRYIQKSWTGSFPS